MSEIIGCNGGWTVHLQQRMGEAHSQQRLHDNTGGSLYDAAILLAKHLLRSTSEAATRYRGMRALELGAGPGLPAVVAAMLAGKDGHAVATDGNEMIAHLAAHNFSALAGASPGIAVPKAARSPPRTVPMGRSTMTGTKRKIHCATPNHWRVGQALKARRSTHRESPGPSRLQRGAGPIVGRDSVRPITSRGM